MEVRDHTEELNELMRRRLEELEELRKRGVDPYPYYFERTATSREVLEEFKDGRPSRDISAAGRIMAIRRMGKASFAHIQDSSGRIQIYLKKDDLGDIYDAFRLMDIGDIVGVHGEVFRTKMGEISIHVRKLQLLSKALRPLPVVKEKLNEGGKRVVYDPFADKELRYRQRYVDLIVNPEVREVFAKRAEIIRVVREFLNARNYLEVETPVLQPLYGGAFARPFVAHHNALDIDFYLRIADELYLKRLIVGGFDGVYEISKDFRNEGMDRLHNPEFTMLELYVAYKDYHWMMGLVEQLFVQVSTSLNGSPKCSVGKREIDFTPPWKRMTFFGAIQETTGRDLRGKNVTELRTAARELQLDVKPTDGVADIVDSVFGLLVQPHLIQPTFIMDYPVEMSPLAKKHRTEAGLVERFEAFVNGQEICNAFSELNDPLDQRLRFEEQMKLRAGGYEEAQVLDEDFLRALEYGMPPTAGLGVGIDRLSMIFTSQESIRDVILFPQMRPER